MKKIRRLFLMLFSGVFLVSGAVIPAQAADNYYNRARIYHYKGNPAFLVCENWSGTDADPDCARGSRTGMLAVGENSYKKFGWIDTDGYYIGRGYYANDSCRGGRLRGWIKERGSLIQPHTCTVTIVRG